ncbi:MAG: sigma-54-dependent Fis family transcriptional regulator, partial [Anaerolineae bacterium]|nr:sigma-54-dependent Fis family transcriptional regulator [Phycisphaerae bacterium]
SGDYIEAHDLPFISAQTGEEILPGSKVSLEDLELLHIRRVLASSKSLEEAADILGIDVATLWRRRKKYGI